MAMTTNLPPQAYTRDTLVKAIEWLSTQPPTVRERATSADLIVTHYLQARRKAAAQMEAPVSGETFKADLKHLVEDLKRFEEPSAPPTPPNRSPSFGPFDQFLHEAPAPQPQPQPAAPKGPTWHIDARTFAAAREIQQRFNFSSEAEALRFLVTLGMERARDLFP